MAQRANKGKPPPPGAAFALSERRAEAAETLLASLLCRPAAAATLHPAFKPSDLPKPNQSRLGTWLLDGLQREAPAGIQEAALEGFPQDWLQALSTRNETKGLDNLAQISRGLSAAAFAADAADAAESFVSSALTSPFRTQDINRAFGEAVAGVREAHATLLSPPPTPHTEQLDAYVDTLKKRAERGTEVAIPYGFPKLDAVTQGLHPSHLLILAGRPTVGKTTLALNVAQTVVRQGHGVLFISLEMTSEELMERMIAGFGIPLHRLRSGRLTAEDLKRLKAAHTEISGYHGLTINDAPPPGIQGIIDCIHERASHGPLKLVVIDYLQRVREPAGSRTETRNEQLGRLTGELKSAAKDLKCATLALSQLSRAIERRADPTPQLADLRDSGELEQDADLVLMLHHPLSGSEVIVAKHRFGPAEGRIRLNHEGAFMRFTEMPNQSQPADEVQYGNAEAMNGDGSGA